MEPNYKLSPQYQAALKNRNQSLEETLLVITDEVTRELSLIHI